MNDKLITIKSEVGDNFEDTFEELNRILTETSNMPEEQIIFDLSGCEHLNPFLIMGMLLLGVKYSNIHFECGEHNTPFGDYLRHIYFHEKGLKQGSNINLDSYRSKTYIPIVSFSCLGKEDERNDFISTIEDVLVERLNIKGKMLNDIRYFIYETVNNIVEHAEVKEGYIFAQYYPK